MRIYLIGFMGSGKTHWGKKLSHKLKLPFFDLDRVIEEKEGKSIASIFAKMGEEYFRMLEKEVLHLVTESHESFVMSCGGGTPCFFNNIDYIKSRGTAVWLNCTVENLYNRLVKEKEKRPLIRNFTDEELRSYIIRKNSDRKIFYRQAAVILSEEEVNLDKLIQTTFHA